MQASAFTKPLKRRDYASFRSNFLQTFGKHSLGKGVNLAVEKLLGGANSKNMHEAQVDANRVSENMMKYPKDNNWADADNMSNQNACQFLEFFSYMLLLKGKTRRGTLALKYEPGEELHEFVMSLKTKMEEKEGEASKADSDVAASQFTSRVAALELDPSYTAVTVSSKPTLTSILIASVNDTWWPGVISDQGI